MKNKEILKKEITEIAMRFQDIAHALNYPLNKENKEKLRIYILESKLDLIKIREKLK